jgi:hypothetical protein
VGSIHTRVSCVFPGCAPQLPDHANADNTGAKELRKGGQQVDGKDEDFTHRANRTITAGTRKTARRVRIASHHEFATHKATEVLTPSCSC